MAQGPLTVVLVCGQRLWRLPPQLASCSHALVWPWDLEAVRAQSSPVMLESAFLLFSLNEYLSRTAIMVQPLNLAEGTEVTGLSAVQIPLPPLGTGTPLQGKLAATGVHYASLGNNMDLPRLVAYRGQLARGVCARSALSQESAERQQ